MASCNFDPKPKGASYRASASSGFGQMARSRRLSLKCCTNLHTLIIHCSIFHLFVCCCCCPIDARCCVSQRTGVLSCQSDPAVRMASVTAPCTMARALPPGRGPAWSAPINGHIDAPQPTPLSSFHPTRSSNALDHCELPTLVRVRFRSLLSALHHSITTALACQAHT